MARIKVLDCTLRDGGYCNAWHFGEKNIRRISSGLVDAGVEIIELGFITNRIVYDRNASKYTTVGEAAKMIPSNRKDKLFVCMINYGEYNAEDIPPMEGSSIDGIRVAFHKKDRVPALEFCKKIMEKGYKVFIQAMVTLSYTDEEFLDLIRRVNEVAPDAFYIVDSFGVMKKKDLIRLFYMVDNNLNPNIPIGFHSHNNLQLAYSNAQNLTEIQGQREIIIDCSVFGMGRGAGNLNTELFVEYLNDNIGTQYLLKPLLIIIDEILNEFYQQNYWGYSLPNYLSAKHNAHPNYAAFLEAKQTLTVENMDAIFYMMDSEKKFEFNKNYVEELYIKYMTAGKTHSEHLSGFKSLIAGREVLIIAPGRSTLEEKDKVIACSRREDVVTISINFDFAEADTDYIFLSNLRRYRELDSEKRNKCIVTSNIPAVDVYLQTEYKELMNSFEAVEDNAGMMLIKLLIKLGARKIMIAGIDGYSVDPDNNFTDQRMRFYTKKAVFEAMNEGLNAAMAEFSKLIDIEYVTTPKYVRI